MECERVRELCAAGLADGSARPDEIERHLALCGPCREALEGLGEAWALLAVLPPVEPRPALFRTLRRRLRVEAARAALASLTRWQQAALIGVVASVVSVLLSLVLPYDAVVGICRDLVATVLPTPGAYALAGILYGFLPLVLGSAVRACITARPTMRGALEASVAFGVVLAPYLVLRCGEFPQSLLIGFAAGVALGALAGSAAGTWVTQRHSRAEASP